MLEYLWFPIYKDPAMIGQLITHHRSSIYNQPKRPMYSGNWMITVHWEPGVTYAQKKQFARKYGLLRVGRENRRADRYISTQIRDGYEIMNEFEADPVVFRAEVAPSTGSAQSMF